MNWDMFGGKKAVLSAMVVLAVGFFIGLHPGLTGLLAGAVWASLRKKPEMGG